MVLEDNKDKKRFNGRGNLNPKLQEMESIISKKTFLETSIIYLLIIVI